MGSETAIEVPPTSYLSSGHGSSLNGSMNGNPFHFVLHVSDCLTTKCYRSDDHFLVLVYCPHFVKCVILSVLSLPINLLSCGDIEANPGPCKNEMLSKILAGQDKISNTIKKVQTSQNEIEKKFCALTERLGRLERQLTDLNSLNSKVNDMETSVSSVKKQLSALISKMDDLENKSRRNNLLIYGTDEPSNKTKECLQLYVNNKIFQKKS